MPGKDFLAFLLQAGFHRVGLVRYTGFKSSQYTEGALFYGERLAAGMTREDAVTQAQPGVAAPEECVVKIGGP